ncbi:formate dehydrogenase accessory sulfurtransferase FdhD [Cohnella sp. GbtcB17]|uniref:formate dehydrogenase accessory sulfurtransferase FdhD n=1 Tax=Cohnella sp. GbtcB17 TaxID=2824762 RepID=UPI001C2F2C76|nr:formate dehydrogenase accessory sulfurtransferase FdhD [Cohnella sp. GbtcB17]
MERPSIVKWTATKMKGGLVSEREEDVAAEYPLTLIVDGEEFATLVCSPSDLTDLVFGFLGSEGVIRVREDIKTLTLDVQGGFARVELVRPLSTAKDFYSKRLIGSCCGKSRQFYFQNDARTAKTLTGGLRIPAGRCFEWMSRLQAASADFAATGGVHNAALLDESGAAETRSDIGRHNAPDKLFGHCIRHRLSARDRVIVFSGRLSSEVVLKAAKIGCPILLSKSAPTDLALRLADDLGITCVGFIRADSLNVYTHHHRIVMD